MFKKNSWIVALLLALTLTAFFTGCIDALVVEEASYDEVELGDFNIWGGQPYQRGWAVGGMKFLGVADKAEVAKDLGYKNEDFAKATKLVIEMEDSSHPSGNLDIIWGAADADGNSVGFDWKQTGSIKSSKDGNILTIDLTAMGQYKEYKTGDFAMRKLVLQAGGEKAGLPFVKKAKLLIPLKEEEFNEWGPDKKGDYLVPANTDPNEFYLDLNNAQIHATNNKTLTASIDKATNKLIVNVIGNVNAVFIPFTPEQRALVCAAGDPIKVTVTGTNGGKVRWCLGINDANNWNATGWGGNNTAGATAGDYDFDGTEQSLTVGNDRWTGRQGVVFNSNTDAVAVPYTWQIESIKVSYTPPTPFNGPINVTTLTAPVTEAQAVTSISGTEWTGAVTWSPALRDGKYFEPYKSYAATIVFSPKAGYTFGTVNVTGVGIASWDPIKRTVVTTPFSSTYAKQVSNTTLSGIRPFTGNTPKTTYDNLQYYAVSPATGVTGIAWSPAVSGKFADNQVYQATITLKVKEGYIWTGTDANSFSVVGATTVTNPAVATGGGAGTTLTVTATFPATVAPGVEVKVGGVSQILTDSALVKTKSTVVISETGGYTWSRASDGAWQNAYVAFKVTLPEGKSINDYTSIKFTLVAGPGGSDNDWKGVGVFVSDTPTITPDGTAGASGPLENNGYQSAQVTKTWDIADSPYVNGANKDVAVTTSTSRTPYICIYVHANTSAVYTISGIELIE